VSSLAVKIARDWTVPAGAEGCLSRLLIDMKFLDQAQRSEYCIPDERLGAFNEAFIDQIEDPAELPNSLTRLTDQALPTFAATAQLC